MRKPNYRYYRRIRTSQERRLEELGYDWAEDYGKIRVRGRRTYSNIPHSWDDLMHSFEKSWKATRKVQYREHGLRLEKNRHEILIPNVQWRNPCYKYETYFAKHNIPYDIESIRKRIYFWDDYRYKWRYRSVPISYRVSWWSTKDIGIEYIKEAYVPPEPCWW